jgi:TusA-related sulfurtransferase
VINRIGFLFVVAISAPALVVGCKAKETPKTDTPPVPSAPTADVSASASAPAASASGSASAAAGKMAHCPASVAGATTEIKDSKDGIVITVLAKDAAATAEIRTRAKFLSESAKDMTPDVKHTGSGEGGGAFGRCVVVMRNTMVDAKDVPGGSEIAVKPKEAKELDWVRRESRDREKEMGDPGAKEAGQGKMAHCPSAVPGATTTVKDSKDGVAVTIVAKDEAGMKDIRERGKALLEAAKADAKTVVHKGDGSGGGGYGRCPVDLVDTTVESKEVPLGLVFSVKPLKPADLATIRKESRERAAAFGGAAPTTK